MNFDGLGVKPMFVLGDCQQKLQLSALKCFVAGTDYAGLLKVSASVGYSSAEVPEPYDGNWSKDLTDLQETKLIWESKEEGSILKTNDILKTKDILKAILKTSEK